MRRTAALTLWLVAVGACGGAKNEVRDTSVTATPRATAAAPRADSSTATSQATNAPASPNAGCVSEGTWQTCSVEKRLTDAGFVPVNKGAAPTGIFDVAGTKYALGAAELDVYIFSTEKERGAAIAGIDTVTVTKGGGGASPWSMPPTLITSNNLVAVLLSDNGRLIERVQLAITAGLPSAQR